MKIMLSRDLKEEYMEKIRKIMPGYELIKALDVDSQEREIIDSDILISFPTDIDVEIIKKANNLKWLHSWSAGVDMFTAPEIITFLIENDIKLTTSSGIHGNIIDEQTLGLMISFSRRATSPGFCALSSG